MVSWDQLQNYLLPISNHWSGYIPEQWKGTNNLEHGGDCYAQEIPLSIP